MTSRSHDDPIDPATDSVTPLLWTASVSAERTSSLPGKRAPVAPVVEPLAHSLGVDLAVGIDSFDAHFCVLAATESEAMQNAQRRWFYLANDLELPAWSITRFSVAIADPVGASGPTGFDTTTWRRRHCTIPMESACDRLRERRGR